MSDFKSTIRNWVKLDEEINILQKRINKLKKKKMDLSPNLISFMNKSNKDKININSSYNIVIGSRTQYASITKAYIAETLNKFLEKELADQIIDNLYDSREKKIINNLEIKKK